MNWSYMPTRPFQTNRSFHWTLEALPVMFVLPKATTWSALPVLEKRYIFVCSGPAEPRQPSLQRRAKERRSRLLPSARLQPTEGGDVAVAQVVVHQHLDAHAAAVRADQRVGDPAVAEGVERDADGARVVRHLGRALAGPLDALVALGRLDHPVDPLDVAAVRGGALGRVVERRAPLRRGVARARTSAGSFHGVGPRFARGQRAEGGRRPSTAADWGAAGAALEVLTPAVTRIGSRKVKAAGTAALRIMRALPEERQMVQTC